MKQTINKVRLDLTSENTEWLGMEWFSGVSVISAISCVCVSSVQWMMGNAVQCAVWCESQYDGEATSGGYRAEGHRPDS